MVLRNGYLSKVAVNRGEFPGVDALPRPLRLGKAPDNGADYPGVRAAQRQRDVLRFTMVMDLCGSAFPSRAWVANRSKSDAATPFCPGSSHRKVAKKRNLLDREMQALLARKVPTWKLRSCFP